LVLEARALIRLNRPADAVAVLVADMAEFTDPLLRIEAEVRLALAYATMNDFASAGSYLASLQTPQAEAASLEWRAEMASTEALIAWMRGDLAAADEALTRARLDPSQLARGRNLITEAWLEARRGNYANHARLLVEGAERLQTADVLDVGVLGPAVRAISNMAREISVPGLLRSASELHSSLTWTDDLAVDEFNSARTLGWALALQGSERYFESLRLLHRASAIAPTPGWRVWSLLDRAAMKRYAGELASSSADLYEALDLAKNVSWGETSDEERTGLLYAAELTAAVDTGEASSLLARFSQVHESFSTRMAVRGDQRLDAGRAYSTGVVQEALGDTRKAKHFYESAYFTYDEIGYAWRAARTALHLYQVTQDAAWHDAARQKIRDYPLSWIAADVREASSGVADEGWNRLTPRQREVFGALCEGMTAKRIADRLDCSPNTVRNHIHWIYQAFRVQSQPELITEARKRKLV
jgi:DNA-binding CsgD family transcriptional regulator/tetratricopeptide (TPR) repeat protein